MTDPSRASQASGSAPPAAAAAAQQPALDDTFSVYHPPNPRLHAPPPWTSDEDFEPTTAELQRAFRDVITQRNGPDAPLMTSAMRAKRDAAEGRSKPKYDTVRIRVRFADRSQVEKTFPHSATINDVYAFVDAAIDPAAGAGDYVLFQTPPKRDFVRAHPDLRTTTLVQLGFAPAAMLSIRWTDVRRNATDAPAPLKPELLSRARELPAVPSFTGTQVPSVRTDNSGDAKDAREKRKFPKWFKSTGGSSGRR